MKTLTMTALMGAFLVAATPALAGRDEMVSHQVNKVMAAKQAAQLQLAKQQQQGAQTGLAGATGQSGKVGPTTEQGQPGKGARRWSYTNHP